MRDLRRSVRYRRDLLDIWFYVSAAGDRAADAAIDRIGETEARLLAFPELGTWRENLPSAVRAFPSGRHLIFYQRADDYIEMLRVVDGRRDISAIELTSD